jgi:hypothetical protein
MRAHRADYGALERDELGHLTAADRLTLLEAGRDGAYEEAGRGGSLRTSLTAAAMARREQPPAEHTELSQLVILFVACVLAATTAGAAGTEKEVERIDHSGGHALDIFVHRHENNRLISLLGDLRHAFGHFL